MTLKCNGLNQPFNFAPDFMGQELTDGLLGSFISDPCHHPEWLGVKDLLPRWHFPDTECSLSFLYGISLSIVPLHLAWTYVMALSG